MSRKKQPDNEELSLIMLQLMQIQSLREETWREKHKTKILPKELLKLREITERCKKRVQICNGQVYPKHINKDLYTFGDTYDNVLRHANYIVRIKYSEKPYSDSDESNSHSESAETRDCICEETAADPLPISVGSNCKSIESAPQTEPLCSKYAIEGRDLSIIGRSESTVDTNPFEHPVAGPSSSADLSVFSATETSFHKVSSMTDDNSLNPSNSIGNMANFQNLNISADVNKKEKDYSDLFASSESEHSTTEDADFAGLLESLNIDTSPFLERKEKNIVANDSNLPSDETDDSSDSESIDEDSPEYEQKLIRRRMRDILKTGYKRIRNEMGKTFYWSLRPERRSNDFRVYPEEDPMFHEENPVFDKDKAIIDHKKNSVKMKQSKRKMSCKSSERDKQNIDINNDITLLAVKDCKELNNSNSHFGKRAKKTSIKEIKSSKSDDLTASLSSTDSQNRRQTRRKISAKSSSKLSSQKNLRTNMPDKSSIKASTSSRKQKGQFANKRKKSISSIESPVKKRRKISRNVSYAAEQKIIKSTKVAPLKPYSLQFSTKSKLLMKEGNLFSSDKFISISEQETMTPKSTRVSIESGQKVKLGSSKKSLSLVAGEDESSGNTGSKFQKVSKKTRQKTATSSRSSVQSSAMKLCSKSKLNVSTELQNKVKQSKRKPSKDSSVQMSEAEVKSHQSSKSERIKKRKAESGNLVTRQLRSMSKKRK